MRRNMCLSVAFDAIDDKATTHHAVHPEVLLFARERNKTVQKRRQYKIGSRIL